MSGAATAAVAVGLIVGIAFVLLVSVFATSGLASYPSSRQVSKIVIPKGAASQGSGVNFEPPFIKVILGVNNTVSWTNLDNSSHFIESDSNTDPAFENATSITQTPLLQENGVFTFTFEQPGEYGYHSQPWLRGTVEVLPPSNLRP